MCAKKRDAMLATVEYGADLASRVGKRHGQKTWKEMGSILLDGGGVEARRAGGFCAFYNTGVN